MVSTRKKRQSNKRLLSQLDDFDRNMIIGDTVCERQESFVPNEDTNAQDFTGGTSNVSSIADENALNVKALERCFNERIDREMSNIVDTVEDRIENAILTAIDNIIAPKIELAIRSINASSGRDVTSMSASSERRERAGINASFENVSENNNTLDVPNKNDGARHNSQVEVSELSVPGTYFDRQPHTHRMVSGLSDETHHTFHRSWLVIDSLAKKSEKITAVSPLDEKSISAICKNQNNPEKKRRNETQSRLPLQPLQAPHFDRSCCFGLQPWVFPYLFKRILLFADHPLTRTWFTRATSCLTTARVCPVFAFNILGITKDKIKLYKNDKKLDYVKGNIKSICD